MDWRGWAGEVENAIDFHVKWESDAVMNELKKRVVKKMPEGTRPITNKTAPAFTEAA